MSQMITQTRGRSTKTRHKGRQPRRDVGPLTEADAVDPAHMGHASPDVYESQSSQSTLRGDDSGYDADSTSNLGMVRERHCESQPSATALAQGPKCKANKAIHQQNKADQLAVEQDLKNRFVELLDGRMGPSGRAGSRLAGGGRKGPANHHGQERGDPDHPPSGGEIHGLMEGNVLENEVGKGEGDPVEQVAKGDKDGRAAGKEDGSTTTARTGNAQGGSGPWETIRISFNPLRKRILPYRKRDADGGGRGLNGVADAGGTGRVAKNGIKSVRAAGPPRVTFRKWWERGGQGELGPRAAPGVVVDSRGDSGNPRPG